VNERINSLKIDSTPEQDSLLKRHQEAKKFWQDLVSKANAP
jgi:hypothetical protein